MDETMAKVHMGHDHDTHTRNWAKSHTHVQLGDELRLHATNRSARTQPGDDPGMHVTEERTHATGQ